MKPLNLDNSPCSPISSNCVVWQGPDISCLNLCTGDTISDVVAAMATELCTILDTLKVSNYDLTCFNLQACGPEDFQALIQFLITKICELEGIPATKIDTIDCPSCVVSVADCFVTGAQTTMELVDYVQLIGERICSIITDISLINSQITDILIRLENLEETPVPTFTLPSFTINCQIGSLLSGSTQQIDTLLEEFINNVWCGYTTATGSGSDLTSAVGMACITDASISLNKSPQTMAVGYAGQWVPDASYDTVADAINNIWISLCDIFNYLSSLNLGITVTDTNTVDLELSPDNELTAKVQDTGWVNLEGFDWYIGGADVEGIRPQCRRIGNVIHFRGIAYIPLIQTGKAIIEELNGPDHYNNLTDVAPATSGTGSVFTDPAGSIKWNQNQSVIPPTVVSALENLDGVYRLPYPTIMSRAIDVGANGTMLSSVGRLGILSTGVLYFATLKDQELPSTVGMLLKGASPLRYINTNIVSGSSIPNFINEDTNIHNLAAPGANNLQADSGFPDPAGTDVTWPISCDAAEEDQIGGFYATLEGLTAFVSCNSTTAITSCYTP